MCWTIENIPSIQSHSNLGSKFETQLSIWQAHGFVGLLTNIKAKKRNILTGDEVMKCWVGFTSITAQVLVPTRSLSGNPWPVAAHSSLSDFHRCEFLVMKGGVRFYVSCHGAQKYNPTTILSGLLCALMILFRFLGVVLMMSTKGQIKCQWRFWDCGKNAN